VAKSWPQLRPLPHGFVADNDAARGPATRPHTKTEREAEIQPHGVTDDLRREPISGVAGASGCGHPIRLLTPTRRRRGRNGGDAGGWDVCYFPILPTSFHQEASHGPA